MTTAIFSGSDVGFDQFPSPSMNNVRERSDHSLPIMSPSLISLGRRSSAGSPTPRATQIPMGNKSFLPSTSQSSSLATATNTKATGRFTDALASFSGRTRSQSVQSHSKGSTTGRGKNSESSADASTFGIDADPFASHYSTSYGTRSERAPSTSSLTVPTPTSSAQPRRQRGSLLVAASDALTFGRGISSSLSRRASKRVPEKPPQQDQSRKGVLWKGKWRGKGQWALQPQMPTAQMSDVIEISAAKAGKDSAKPTEEEDEQRERERLREAAAESIGLSALMRDDASTRLNGNDGLGFVDDSGEDGEEFDFVEEALHQQQRVGTPESWAEKLRANGNANAGGTVKANGAPPLQLQIIQAQPHGRENRYQHQRGSSISTTTSPTSPTSILTTTTSWNRGSSTLTQTSPPYVVTSSGIKTISRAQPPHANKLPDYPCTYGTLAPYKQKTALLFKHYPAASLLMIGLSRQWRTRFIVLTAPPRSPISSQQGSNNQATSVYHLHLFKSSALDERELERLEVNERSVVCVADQEIAGKRSVVKVGGVDVGALKRDASSDEDGRAMWFLYISHGADAQSWIATLKNAVLTQRAERAGLPMSVHYSNTPEPKGDLDVMLSLRQQDHIFATSRRQSVKSESEVTRPDSVRSNRAEQTKSVNGISSPSTVRARSIDGRNSPVAALKGFFAVPGRPRSPSRGSVNCGDEGTAQLPEGAASFSSRGNTLLSMLRSTGNPNSPTGGVSQGENRSASPLPIIAPQPIPGPIVNAAPILSSIEASLDKPTTSSPEFPEWYSLNGRAIGRNANVPPPGTQSLRPPPRTRRPWTSSSIPPPKDGNVSDSGSIGRISFQGSSSYAAGRRSEDESARSQSPVDSLGTAPGVFGTPEHRPRRASMSSSVSSFTSGAIEREAALNASNRRLRLGMLPKMPTPPSGPPPSVPVPRPSSSSQVSSGGSGERSVHPYAQDQPSSFESNSQGSGLADMVQRNAKTSTSRRMSASSVPPASASNTTAHRLGKFNAAQKLTLPTSPTKRASMPPPPRPAPTFALPPTPSQLGKPSEAVTPKKTSFRESFSHRSLRFSLSPPPTKALPPRPDDGKFRGHRRSFSSDSTTSKNNSMYGKSSSIPSAPRAPPPTGPLPPTPQDSNALSRRTSLKERLRLKSAPSPPSHVSQTSPVTSPAHLAPVTKPAIRISDVPLGQPITPLANDLNFLNMTPTESMTPITIPTHDANFLNMSPLTATTPIPISPRPPRHSISPLGEPAESSPPTMEMTVLPPPPRRSRQPVVLDKEQDADSDIVPPSSIAPTISITEDAYEGEGISMHRGSSVSISRTSSSIAD